jgi:hypothetical protein
MQVCTYQLLKRDLPTVEKATVHVLFPAQLLSSVI